MAEINKLNTVRKSMIDPEFVQEVQDTTNKIGNLSELKTTNKTDIVKSVNEVSSQLADTAKKTEVQSLVVNKAEKTYVDTLAASLASGSPKGTYATLSALQTAFPTGNTNIYVVTADGNWYYWNGSTWTIGGVYQSTGLQDGIVKAKKLEPSLQSHIVDINNIIYEKNILNPYRVLGKPLSSATGKIFIQLIFDLGGVEGLTLNDLYTVDFTYTTKDRNIKTFGYNVYLTDTSTPSNLAGNTNFNANENLPVIYDVDARVNYKQGVYSSAKRYLRLFLTPTQTDITKLSEFFFSNVSVKIGSVNITNLVSVVGFTLSSDSVIESGVYDLSYSSANLGTKIKAIKEEVDQLKSSPSIATYFSNKKWGFIGDSQTQGWDNTEKNVAIPYPNTVAEILRLDSFVNYGIAGSTIARSVKYPVVDRLTSLATDLDIISVFAGTNDWGHSTTSVQRPLGTIDSTDVTTFYGALNYICDYLITNYPTKLIFLGTPLHREGENTPNSLGLKLIDYVNAIRLIGQKYSLPVLDLYNTGNLYPDNASHKSQLIKDGIHPTQWYYTNVLARKFASFAKTII